MTDSPSSLLERAAQRVDRLLHKWWVWVVVPPILAAALTYVLYLIFG